MCLSMYINNAVIAQRLNDYIEHEKISKDYIADLSEKSPSTIYRSLSEQNQNIAAFSMQIAELLNLPTTFFLKDEFYLPIQESTSYSSGTIAFSKDDLSPVGMEDVKDIIQLCNILSLYSSGDNVCQN